MSDAQVVSGNRLNDWYLITEASTRRLRVRRQNLGSSLFGVDGRRKRSTHLEVWKSSAEGIR